MKLQNNIVRPHKQHPTTQYSIHNRVYKTIDLKKENACECSIYMWGSIAIISLIRCYNICLDTMFVLT